MRTNHRTLLSAALLCCATGCYHRSAYRPMYTGGAVVYQQQQPPPPQQQQPPPPGYSGGVAVSVTGTVQVPQGVTTVAQACTPGAPEQCNGIDDNCNGAIDEGCGYNTGSIQVTAAWNTQSDIDLHVIDPRGEEIFYGHRQSMSGGILDHDANANCSASPPPVENVYWSTQPMPGTYQARVAVYSMCGAPVTPVTLSIAVGGRVIGTYQITMQADGQDAVIPFQVQ